MSKEQIYNTKRFGLALMAALVSLSVVNDYRNPGAYVAALIAGVGTYYNILPSKAPREK